MTGLRFRCGTVAHPPNTAWYIPCPGCDTSLFVGDGRCRAALKSNHPGGIHVVMCDGSVHFIGNGIDLTVYQDLADRDDGHPSVSF